MAKSFRSTASRSRASYTEDASRVVRRSAGRVGRGLRMLRYLGDQCNEDSDESEKERAVRDDTCAVFSRCKEHGNG